MDLLEDFSVPTFRLSTVTAFIPPHSKMGGGGGETGLDWCMIKPGKGTLEYRTRLMSCPFRKGLMGKGGRTKNR